MRLQHPLSDHVPSAGGANDEATAFSEICGKGSCPGTRWGGTIFAYQPKLASLEQDNAHEDPHANIVWRKDLPNFEDEMIGGPKKKGSRKRPSSATPGSNPAKRRRKFRARRFRNFISALDEANQKYRKNKRLFRAFFKATAPAPKVKGRKFCAPCGDVGIYSCIRCGTPYCSIACRDIHMDTRCQRWVR
ncbi:HIT zinc finger [Oesophagostomum dentatum]|uniref:HIT zinc finger n=1 Tax=Oesophagostomum dentatum TaxID=61180 RepID=A0A0B1TRG1_OESDE|nr:HIT zinc finger [Oesophagostomum dentatum]